MDYTNWAEYEPDSEFGGIRTNDGLWSSGQKWDGRPYICKTAKGNFITLTSNVR